MCSNTKRLFLSLKLSEQSPFVIGIHQGYRNKKHSYYVKMIPHEKSYHQLFHKPKLIGKEAGRNQVVAMTL